MQEPGCDIFFKVNGHHHHYYRDRYSITCYLLMCDASLVFFSTKKNLQITYYYPFKVVVKMLLLLSNLPSNLNF